MILLFTANGISGFAQGVSMLSVPWYFARQGLSERFNLLYAIATALMLIWGLYAGTIVDRYNRKRVFLGTNILEGAIVLSIAAAGWYIGDLPWYLIITVFGITLLGYQIHYPNLYAFAQEITPPNKYKYVTSYIEIVGQTTNVLAGVLAAILLEGVQIDQELSFWGLALPFRVSIVPWTIYEIFTLDGGTYLISVVLISFIRYMPVVQKEVETGSVAKRIRSGIRFLYEHQTIFLFGLASYAVFVVMLVKLNALMPVYIRQHLQEGGDIFGTMEVLYALGALSAGLYVRRLFEGIRLTRAIIWLMILAAFALFLSAATRSVPVFLAVGLMIGFSNSGIRVLRLSYLFDHIPNAIIGRANSVFSMLNILMRVLFILLFSHAFFHQDSNITWAYAIMGVFTLASTMVLLLGYRRFTTV